MFVGDCWRQNAQTDLLAPGQSVHSKIVTAGSFPPSFPFFFLLSFVLESVSVFQSGFTVVVPQPRPHDCEDYRPLYQLSFYF